MNYVYNEYKTVVVLASSVEPAIALNIVGHLALSLGRCIPDWSMGRDFLVDKSGIKHRGISKYPVIITRVKQQTVRRAIQEARMKTNVVLVEFPKEMSNTGHDDELNTAIGNTEEGNLEYLGAILFGKREEVDSITGKFMLWK